MKRPPVVFVTTAKPPRANRRRGDVWIIPTTHEMYLCRGGLARRWLLVSIPATPEEQP